MIPLDQQTSRQIVHFQETEIIKLLQYVNSSSPYYQELFKNHNYDISTFKNLNDLIKIPTSSKINLQESNWDFLCVDKNFICLANNNYLI